MLYPERLDCNGDTEDTKLRCPFMKYNRLKSFFDNTRWECRFKKALKDKQLNSNLKGDNTQ